MSKSKLRQKIKKYLIGAGALVVLALIIIWTNGGLSKRLSAVDANNNLAQVAGSGPVFTSVTINNVSAGGNWIPGAYQTVRWNGNAFAPSSLVSIHICEKDKLAPCWALRNTAKSETSLNDGSESVQMPSSAQTIGILPTKQYYIRVLIPGQVATAGKSANFWVKTNTSGPVLTLLGTETSNSAGPGANDDMGTFKIRFRVTAVGGAIYVPSLAIAGINTTGNNGRSVAIVDRAGTATKGGVSVILTNTSDSTLTSRGNYKIEDGQSENFELTTTAQLPIVGNAGLYRASLAGLAWSLTDITPVTNLYTLSLDSFKTAYNGLN